MSISRSQILKTLMPGLEALYGIPSYHVKKRGNTYDLVEIRGTKYMNYIAEGLTKKEANALLKLTTEGERK